MSVTSPQTAAAAAYSDKYVLFALAGETYALSVLQVLEVLAEFTLTTLPSLPDYVLGVMPLRGDFLPVIDLRERCGFSRKARDTETRVLVVDLEEQRVGVQVDRVLRVVSLAAARIGAAPSLAYGRRARFVAGVSEQPGGKLVVHLDMREVLSSLDRLELAAVSESIRAARASEVGPAVDTLAPAPSGRARGAGAVSEGPDGGGAASAGAPSQASDTIAPRSV